MCAHLTKLNDSVKERDVLDQMVTQLFNAAKLDANVAFKLANNSVLYTMLTSPLEGFASKDSLLALHIVYIRALILSEEKIFHSH